MIPELPEGMGIRQLLMFYDTLSGNLSDQSTIHKNWHTHRGNPSTCWICDQTTLLSKVLTLAFKINTKSSVDIMTNEEQYDSDSESEIENLNKDDETYNEPEFDICDDPVHSPEEEVPE